LLITEYKITFVYYLKLRRISMKLKSILVVPALLGALVLSACGEKPAEEAAEATPAETAAPVAEPVEAPPAAVEHGGYVPTPEELVPGITRTKEEQDKINAEAMAGTPMPVIPGEAAPAPTEVPVEAPAEAAPEAK
jgi:hypothetical protein